MQEKVLLKNVQCVPKGNSYQQLQQLPFTQNGNFAIYGIEGCADLLGTNPQVCTPLNGLTGISIGVAI